MTLKVRSANGGGELRIYGSIDEGLDTEVADALSQYSKQPVTVYVNSPGGFADVGLAVYENLRRHGSIVTTIVDGLAASAGSVIAAAGTIRFSAPSARWMIHKAIVLTQGNANDLRRMASTLDKYDQAIESVYRRIMPGVDIAKMMAAETWFTAQEAVDVGLSTGILEGAQRATTRTTQKLVELIGLVDRKAALAGRLERYRPAKSIRQKLNEIYKAGTR